MTHEPTQQPFNGQMNVNDQANKSFLVDRIEVTGTPFMIIGLPDKGYFISLGKYRLSKGGLSKKECLRLIQTRDWELIFAMVGVALEEQDNMKKHYMDKPGNREILDDTIQKKATNQFWHRLKDPFTKLHRVLTKR